MIGPVENLYPHQNGASSTLADADLWKAAQMLEATFLAEMLKSAGLGEARGDFGGGIGEDQFAGMLATEQAKVMAEAGGIGLAEAIYRSLAQEQEA